MAMPAAVTRGPTRRRPPAGDGVAAAAMAARAMEASRSRARLDHPARRALLWAGHRVRRRVVRARAKGLRCPERRRLRVVGPHRRHGRGLRLAVAVATGADRRRSPRARHLWAPSWAAPPGRRACAHAVLQGDNRRAREALSWAPSYATIARGWRAVWEAAIDGGGGAPMSGRSATSRRASCSRTSTWSGMSLARARRRHPSPTGRTSMHRRGDAHRRRPGRQGPPRDPVQPGLSSCPPARPSARSAGPACRSARSSSS